MIANTGACKSQLQALAMGALGACSFPLALPGWGHGPLLEAGPRELLVLVYGAWIYAQMRGPGSLWQHYRRLSWAGVGHYALLIYWLDIALERFGGLPVWVAWPALGALVALCALLSALVVPLFAVLKASRQLPTPVCFAAAWVVCEWGRGACTQFPWGQWGYTQTRNLPLIQWAAWGGVWAVSFWVALGAAGLHAAVFTPRASRGKARFIGVGVASIVLGLGQWRLSQSAVAGTPLTVGVVQANIAQDIKSNATRHRASILQTYHDLSEQAVAAGAQVLIWPEGAWPGYLPTDVTRLPMRPLGAPLLAGVSLFEALESNVAGKPDAASTGTVRLFNSALWLTGDLKVAGRYDKQQLVPFGEYVPLGAVLPLHKIVPSVADFTAGAAATAKPLGPQGIGVLICYDGVYPGPSRRHTQAGAQLLVNLTNDAWYGDSSAPYQHRDFYILRAVEAGRWVVRAANSGVSLSIDPQGRMGLRTALNERTWALFNVQLIPSRTQTLYARAGDWSLALCLGAVTGAVLCWVRRR